MRVSLPFVLAADLLLAACSSTTFTETTDGATSSAGPADGIAAGDRADATVPSTTGTLPAFDATGIGESSDASSTGAIGADAGDAGAGESADAGPPPVRPSAACGGDAGSGTGNVDLVYDGGARSYLLHVPASPATAPRPLVLSLHGYFLDGATQEKITGMSSLAETEGFVVAYPNGLGSPRDWNAGACCSAASEGDRDDKGFLGAVIDDIGAHVCVDLARVYVEGFSNGGMMTVRLACEMADRFAAAATVSGSAVVPLDTCRPSRSISFLHIHGTSDPLVPYDGGAGGLPLKGRPTPVFPPVVQESATFQSDDGCPKTSDVYFDQGDTHCDHWGPCNADSEVVLCTVDGGTHAWPAPAGAVLLLNETASLDATTQIWQFLKRHALR